MITLSDALLVAHAHLEQLNRETPVHPHYQYALRTPTEYAHCWYFDYLMQPRPDFPPQKQEMFAGAPGFAVSRQTARLRIISWPELSQLAEQASLRQQCEGAASGLLRKKLSLATLRAHLPRSLAGVVAFKKELETLGDDEQARKEALKAQLLQAAGLGDPW